MLRRAFLTGVAGAAMTAAAAAEPGRERPAGSPRSLSTGFGQLTAVGAGGVPTDASAIVSGNANGDFQITTATWTNFQGDAVTTHVITKAKARLSQPSYALHMNDGTTVEITAEPNVWDVLTQNDWTDGTGPGGAGQNAAWKVANNQTVKFRPNITVDANIGVMDSAKNPFYPKKFGAPGPRFTSRDPSNPCNFAGNIFIVLDYSTWEHLVSPDTRSGSSPRFMIAGWPGHAMQSTTINCCEFYTTPIPIPGDGKWSNGDCIKAQGGPYLGTLTITNCVIQYFYRALVCNPNGAGVTFSGNLVGPYYQAGVYFGQSNSTEGLSLYTVNAPVTCNDNVFFGACAPQGGVHQDIIQFFAPEFYQGGGASCDWTHITIHRNIAFAGPTTQDFNSPAVNRQNGALGVQGPISARGMKQDLLFGTGRVSHGVLTIESVHGAPGGVAPAAPPPWGAYYLAWDGGTYGGVTAPAMAPTDTTGPTIASGSGGVYQLSGADPKLSLPSGTNLRIAWDTGYHYTADVVGNLLVGGLGSNSLEFYGNNGSAFKYNTVVGLGMTTNTSASRTNYETGIYGGSNRDGGSYVARTTITTNNVCERYSAYSDLKSSTSDIPIGFNGVNPAIGSHGFPSCFAGITGAGTGSGKYYNPWNPNWPAWNGTTGLHGRALTFAMPAVIQNVRDMFKARPGGPLDKGGPYKVGACNGAVTWATGVAPSRNASNGVTNV